MNEKPEKLCARVSLAVYYIMSYIFPVVFLCYACLCVVRYFLVFSASSLLLRLLLSVDFLLYVLLYQWVLCTRARVYMERLEAGASCTHTDKRSSAACLFFFTALVFFPTSFCFRCRLFCALVVLMMRGVFLCTAFFAIPFDGRFFPSSRCGRAQNYIFFGFLLRLWACVCVCVRAQCAYIRVCMELGAERCGMDAFTYSPRCGSTASTSCT